MLYKVSSQHTKRDNNLYLIDNPVLFISFLLLGILFFCFFWLLVILSLLKFHRRYKPYKYSFLKLKMKKINKMAAHLDFWVIW